MHTMQLWSTCVCVEIVIVASVGVAARTKAGLDSSSSSKRNLQGISQSGTYNENDSVASYTKETLDALSRLIPFQRGYPNRP
jgi:hypothetical protein